MADNERQGKPQPARTSKRPPFQFSLRALIIAVVVAGVLIGMCVTALQGIHDYRDGLYEDYAFRNVVASTMMYVDSHQGAWPSKWKDLEGVDPKNSPSRVVIDFAADPRKLVGDEKLISAAIFLKSGRPNPDEQSVCELGLVLAKYWAKEKGR